MDRDAFRKVEFLGFELFGDSVQIAHVCQEFRVLSLAQQTPSTTFMFQFSYIHPGPESRTPLTGDCTAGVSWRTSAEACGARGSSSRL